MPEMAARHGEPYSFRAAIWENGRSPTASAAPRHIDKHPMTTKLMRALRSMGKSANIPISTNKANIGDRTHAKSPREVAATKSNALRGGPPRKEPSK